MASAITREQDVFSLLGFSNNHGWNIHKQKMRLFVLLAVILRHLFRGKNLYLRPLGFRRWKKAQDSDSGFKKHVKSETHNSAMMRWNEFKTMVDQSTSVHQMVSEAYAKKVHENRHIKTIGEVLLLTATQDVAQRGHREASIDGNANTGNFLQILQLVARHDEIVMKKIASAPKNAKYTSHQIQDMLLTFLVDWCDGLSG